MIGSNRNESEKQPLYVLWATHQAQNFLLRIRYWKNVCRRNDTVNNQPQNHLLTERSAN